MPRQAVAGSSLRGGLATFVGFALSMVLLAMFSLWAIPEMIRASGAHAWASIATGQSVGTVAAVVLYLGWGISGPVDVARGGRSERGQLYRESLASRGVVAVPVLALAATVAAVVARQDPGLAALAAASAGAVGFTAAWYFVGLASPYRLLAYETGPRVIGTALGILAMRSGSGAWAGVAGQLFGMVAGVAVCTAWILHSTAGSAPLHPRPLGHVLRAQGAGVATSTISATYLALPIVLVGLLSQSALPTFAILDKVQKQIYTAMQPLMSLLQGWVPRAEPGALKRRIRTALLLSGVFCVGVVTVVYLATPFLVAWLGGGSVDLTAGGAALLAVLVATNLFESVTSRASLVPLGRLRFVAQLTTAGAVIGLALIPVGVARWGAAGGLAAVLVGLLVRVGGGLVVIARTPEPDIVRQPAVVVPA